ncbi:hypothetical protein BFP77_06100 [Maribacter sp. 4U21]|uniref:DUF6268 family outer membrane beta-barrel protein n=1 Tax=Maribacter sp. 4U21 TaxID=1889779 RepID=UPI000C45B2B8|nr:DUF6268 family outer membrane beta-barrel protein [Maribacter sp. 4U21]PIB29552.1 hypothetical protein BFP77_06100 [Maribacter sp. 4U21]
MGHGRRLGLVFFVFSVALTIAQTPDVFRAEYMLMPENSFDVRTTRIKLLANVPIPVREKKDFVVLGAEYNKFDYTVPQTTLPNAADLSNFHVLDVNFAYVYKWNEDWRFIGVVTPRWASTFTDGIQREDFNINYTAGGYKEKKNVEKPYRLVLGLSYSATSPIQVPLPFVYYEKRFRPNWAYTIGVPKTGIKLYTKKQHFLQAELFLDGYYVNIQNNILLSNNNLSTDISHTALLLTLGYQYKFTKDISVYLLGGHTITQNGVLRDRDRQNIFTLNNGPGLYFRTGFRIGI